MFHCGCFYLRNKITLSLWLYTLIKFIELHSFPETSVERVQAIFDYSYFIHLYNVIEISLCFGQSYSNIS